MLLPIPIGYFVAVFLTVSGVLNCVEFLENKPADCTGADLLNGLACEGWGIIVAAGLLLLIQINKQLEHIRFAAANTAPAPVPHKKNKVKTKAEEPAPPPAPVPPTPVNAPRQVYPNSPIPGGGRVPRTQPTPAPASMPPSHSEEHEKLSYFKVD